MTNDNPKARPVADTLSGEAANKPERAYLQRRFFQELSLAMDARDLCAKIPHDQMARAYCVRCRAIRDRAECAVCALEPRCQRIANEVRE